MQHGRELHERIRALEAEVQRLQKGLAAAGSEREKLVRTLKACREAGEATAKLANDHLDEVERLKALIRSTLGEVGDFPSLPDDWPERPFYWRSWLREKLKGGGREREKPDDFTAEDDHRFAANREEAVPPAKPAAQHTPGPWYDGCPVCDPAPAKARKDKSDALSRLADQSHPDPELRGEDR